MKASETSNLKLEWHDDWVQVGSLRMELQQKLTERKQQVDRTRQISLHKLPHLYEQFDRFFGERAFHPRHILQLGIFDGGSALLWYEYFRPARLVALDLDAKGDSPAFQKYVDERGLRGSVLTQGVWDGMIVARSKPSLQQSSMASVIS